MPHLQEIYRELQDQGLEIIAVNAGDPRARILEYFRQSGFTFKAVLGGVPPTYAVGTAYRVQAYPTNYLLDAEGRIVWRSTGFDERGLRAALGRLGLRAR